MAADRLRRQGDIRRRACRGDCGEKVGAAPRAEFLGIKDHFRKVHQHIRQRVGNRRNVSLERQRMEVGTEVVRDRGGIRRDDFAVGIGISEEGK
ncbi:hypothetical protein [Rhizobium metallidurans]|uniref:hypothetical protein n=1 Tax=Rhizobium metallidurans TaxID=1265931 RepID=UPI001FE86DD5|nr:hypothetical protein [Rhizobium metallidurans]